MCSFSCMILRQNIFNHMLSSSCVFQSVTGVIECLKIITRKKSRRIAKFAFDYATKKGRNKVTAVHKANIMWVIFFSFKGSFVFVIVLFWNHVPPLRLKISITVTPVLVSYFRKLGDGLFLQSCAEVAQLYPKIKYENIIIDNCCMQV